MPKAPSAIRFCSFPQTEPPPDFVSRVVSVFRAKEAEIEKALSDGQLTSNQLLNVVRPGLEDLGFQVEAKGGRLARPVFFGENAVPTLQYHVDAFHPKWRCGLEAEAGRGFMGNAFYRDFVQAMVMVQVDHLVIALRNEYRFQTRAKKSVQTSKDYQQAQQVAAALYGHTRVRIPFGLTLIGY